MKMDGVWAAFILFGSVCGFIAVGVALMYGYSDRQVAGAGFVGTGIGLLWAAWGVGRMVSGEEG